MPDPKVVGSDPEWSRGASAVYSPHSTKLKSVAGFLFLSFPIGLFWFLVLGTLILLGVALSIIWVGLPILALALTLVNLEAGSGLAGLADRLAALDGRLFVESRVGGPTRLQADLPLDTLNEPLRRTL